MVWCACDSWKHLHSRPGAYPALEAVAREVGPVEMPPEESECTRQVYLYLPGSGYDREAAREQVKGGNKKKILVKCATGI